MSGQHQFHLADPGGEVRYSIRTGTRVKHVRLCVFHSMKLLFLQPEPVEYIMLSA